MILSPRKGSVTINGLKRMIELPNSQQEKKRMNSNKNKLSTIMKTETYTRTSGTQQNLYPEENL